MKIACGFEEKKKEGEEGLENVEREFGEEWTAAPSHSVVPSQPMSTAATSHSIPAAVSSPSMATVEPDLFAEVISTPVHPRLNNTPFAIVCIELSRNSHTTDQST
ncbi:hypothetical protein V6N11_082263 [Hibiscus sabdariffa]|uniref:Uncharacterized protein n=1 Tax=Hibiscus sabdariffa TaxID=183260 RepID=A0ABR2QHG6_9ROSI